MLKLKLNTLQIINYTCQLPQYDKIIYYSIKKIDKPCYTYTQVSVFEIYKFEYCKIIINITNVGTSYNNISMRVN